MMSPEADARTPSTAPVAVEGYGPCRCGCGRQELKHVLHLTGGLSWECFRDDVLAPLRDAEVSMRGALVKMPINQRGRGRKRPGESTGSVETRRKTHAARQAAQKRLVQLHHDLYDVLYADERHKRGLPVVPRRVPEGAFVDTVVTNVAALSYSPEVDSGEMDAEPHSKAI